MTDIDIGEVIVRARGRLLQIEDEITRAEKARDEATDRLKSLRKERTKWGRVVRAYDGAEPEAPSEPSEPEPIAQPTVEDLRARVHETPMISPSVAAAGAARHEPVDVSIATELETADDDASEIVEDGISIPETTTPEPSDDFFPDADDADY